MKAEGPSCHGSVLFSPRVLREKEVGKREKWAVYYLVLLPQFDQKNAQTKNRSNWYISMDVIKHPTICDDLKEMIQIKVFTRIKYY